MNKKFMKIIEKISWNRGHKIYSWLSRTINKTEETGGGDRPSMLSHCLPWGEDWSIKFKKLILKHVEENFIPPKEGRKGENIIEKLKIKNNMVEIILT